jgi:hypothetical protein
MGRAVIQVDISGLRGRLPAAVADVAERRGPDNPLTPGELAELIEAGERMRRAYEDGDGPEAGPADAHLDAVVGIPGAVLHRPTWGCHIRLQRVDEWPIPERWADRAAEWATLVAAFVLAHAYDEAANAALATPEQAEAVIEAWALTLAATPTETHAAVRRLLGDAYPPPPGADGEKKKGRPGPNPSPPSYARLARELAARPAIGSGKSRKRTCAGSCAKSTTAAEGKPRRPAPAARPRSTPATRASRPAKRGANSLTV